MFGIKQFGGGGGKKGRRKQEDDFVNFGLKEVCGNFVKNLYKLVNQIDLDPFRT